MCVVSEYVCVCVCVRACVRACVCACVRACSSIAGHQPVSYLLTLHQSTQLGVAWCQLGKQPTQLQHQWAMVLSGEANLSDFEVIVELWFCNFSQ